MAREKGLAGRVEEVLTDPYANDPPLVAANPIAQVPALVDDDGSVFTDSPIICAYLDEIGQGPRLLPASGPEHWRVRRLAALADGALEMGVKLLLEKRRPEHERSPSWMERWRAGLLRALDAVEAAIPAGRRRHGRWTWPGSPSRPPRPGWTSVIPTSTGGPAARDRRPADAARGARQLQGDDAAVSFSALR